MVQTPTEVKRVKPSGTEVCLQVNVPIYALGGCWAMLNVFARRFNEVPGYWAEAYEVDGAMGVCVVLDNLPPVEAVEDFIAKAWEIRIIVRDTWRRGNAEPE